MAKDILIDSSALGAGLLKTVREDISEAKEKLDKLDYYGAMANATYMSPDGVMPLFPLDYANSAASLSVKLNDILGKLGRYASLLDSGPDGFAEIDGKYKNELTEWWERISPATVFKTVFTLTFPVVSLSALVIDYSANFYIADYKNYGITYKVIESAKALGKAVPAVATCAATWGATILSGGAGAPLAVLSTIYTVNAGVNCLVDLTNIWVTEDYEEVGEYNLLQDTLINNAGDLGELLGNREAGEVVGEMVYDAGDLMETILGLEALSGQIIQSDIEFDTFKDAVEEVPTGLDGIAVILNTPVSKNSLSSVTYDLKLLSHQIPNIKQVPIAYKLLEKTSSATQKYMNFILKFAESFDEMLHVGGE